MNADFLAVLEYWEKEKGISRDVLTSAVQEALLSAAKKAVGPARELRVAIEPKTGDIRAFAELVVSGKVISKHNQVSVGDIISGTVRRFDRSDVIGDLGKYEALLPNRERVPTEEYQVGERIRCYV